ncbi:g13326 [Coccomyxa viridis]|uniref:G13326 protein n=1 Tax=Coccomyxa viridis TaxID=1274662 RepID=A0ABP1GF23_9CHLO
MAAMPQLLPVTSTFGIWATLNLAAALGLWSERTRVGKELSGPLVSTLVGLLFANTGVVSGSNAPAVYDTVNKFILPLAIPLLLFSADLRRIFKETGKLLVAFSIGSVATVVGTLVAFKLIPLQALGAVDSWKIASALAARHIGGAINYVAVSEALQVSPSAQMAGLAADNLLCAVYFTTLFNLAKKIPAEPSPVGQAAVEEEGRQTIKVLEAATGIALSACICYLGQQLAAAIGYPSASISVITILTVVLATCVPTRLAPLVPSSEGIAYILLQIFFAAVGAAGEVRAVIQTAPSLFLFCFLQIAVHLLLILGAGRLAGFSRKELLLASNANVGGPSTAAGMAAAKGWQSMLVPAILIGTWGYSIATPLSIVLGQSVLQSMVPVV